MTNIVKTMSAIIGCGALKDKNSTKAEVKMGIDNLYLFNTCKKLLFML